MTENIQSIERVILSSILFTPSKLDDIADILDSSDFILPLHQSIFETMALLSKAQLPITPEMLRQRCAREINDDELAIIAATNSIANIEDYAHEVKNESIKRRLRELANTLREKSLKSAESSTEILDQIGQEIFAISMKNTKSDFKDAQSVVTKTLEYLSGLKKRGAGDVTGIASGFDELDKLTTGLHPGNLIIIGGRPHMGKTTLALNIAENILNQGRGVAIFSLEMGDVDLAMRLLSSLTRIPLQSIRTGQMSDAEWENLNRASDELSRRELFIDDGSLLTIASLRTKLRRLKQTNKNLGVAMIDYLGLMSGSGEKGANRVQEVTEISRGLKVLAKELELPIIALAQLNRLAEGRDDKRPIMSDLRESGSIEQDADIIVFVYRDDIYLKKADEDRRARAKKENKEFKPEYQKREVEEAELIVAKNRNGETGTARVAFNARFTRFENRPPEVTPELSQSKMLNEIVEFDMPVV